MALSNALIEARRQTATTANRQRQIRAELRLDEIVKAAGIADDYERTDRLGDLEIERHFATLYHLVDTEAEKEAVAAAFAAWMRAEADEDRVVRGSVDGTVSLLKSNNDIFIENVYTPAGSDRVA